MHGFSWVRCDHKPVVIARNHLHRCWCYYVVVRVLCLFVSVARLFEACSGLLLVQAAVVSSCGEMLYLVDASSYSLSMLYMVIHVHVGIIHGSYIVYG